MPRILLPESNDARIIQAARRVVGGGGGAAPLLFAADSETSGAANDGVEYVRPDAQRLNDYTALLQRSFLPKKELTAAQARTLLLADPIYLAAAMLKNGDVDAVVAGAVTATAHVVRTALKVVKLREGVSTLSSFFILRFGDAIAAKGIDKEIIMADCALVIDPGEEQLADIAAAAADSAGIFLKEEPVVAMLSFSTHASAEHGKAKKVAAATALLKQKRPQLQVIGEVQADAALNPQIAARKGINTAHAANVLIFPDLNAANIGYKLVQQFTACAAVGPVLQGLAKPFNDLSRGATTDDIAEMILLTARQCAA